MQKIKMKCPLIILLLFFVSFSVSAESLFDGFESGKIAAFWLSGSYGKGRYVDNAIIVQDKVVRSGAFSALIRVQQGDIRQLGGSQQKTERAEMDSGKYHDMNKDLWYGFSIYLPLSFPTVDTRLVIGQWKQQVDGASPIFAQRFKKRKILPYRSQS